MSVLSLPQNKNWDVSYAHDAAAFVNDSYNMDLFSYPNKMISGPKVIPHTTDSDVANITMATSFAYTNYAGGSRMYVALCSQLLKTSSTSSLFATAVSESSPTNLTDSDIAIQGMSSGGYDIAVLSGPTINLARFDYDVSTTAFNTTWWTGYPQTISSTTNATPVEVTMSADHNYTNGDQIVIRGNSIPVLNQAWTITVTSPTKFTLDNSTLPGSTSGTGKAYRTYDVTNARFESLGQPPLTNSIVHPLMVFGNAPLLFVGDKNLLHSVAPYFTNTDGTLTQPGPTDVQYARLAFKKNYTIKWMRANSTTMFFGLSNDNGDWYPSLVEVYDPFSEQVREFQIDEGSTTGFMYNNGLFIIDYKGNIKLFNGSDFEKKVVFPSAVYHAQHISLPHRNGIAVNEEKAFILIPATGGFVRAGIWCYEPEANRLYHYSSLTFSGTSLNAYGESGARGDSYYGALFFVNPNAFLLGASVLSSTESPTTAVAGVFSNLAKPSASPNVSLTSTISRFATGKIYSDTIDTAYKRLIVKYNTTPTFLGFVPTGKVIVWYRNSDDYRQRSNNEGQWASATTFTTPDASTPVIGESIEVIEGVGSGVMGSVSAVSTSVGGRVTVTLNESPLTLTPTGRFYYVKSNWNRLPVTNDITSASGSWAEIDIPENQTTWMQFMIESRGFYAIESVQLGVQNGLLVEKN